MYDDTVDLSVSGVLEGNDPNDAETKKIEVVITQEVSKSLHSIKGFAHEVDWHKQVSNDLQRVFSSEPWWITKKD